jgi:Ca2+-binding RTX toxin-like protein
MAAQRVFLSTAPLLGRTTMTTTATSLGAALGLALALLPGSSANAEPPTCQGRSVTVTGDTGTDGDDVMVVGPGQKSVETGAGNDLVCIRLSEGDDVRRYFYLGTGPGDDVVHNETAASPRDVSVLLGLGADTYVGSDASTDYVSTGPDSWGGTSDTEKDVVDTRGGADQVSSGSVAPGTPNPDVITTGDGDDGLDWAGVQVSGQVDLGPGENSIRLRSGWSGSDVDIDAPDGLVTVDARPVLRWTGDVTAYTLQYTHLRTTFTGTELGEYLTFWPSQRDQKGPPSSVGDPQLRLDADMAGGDDRLEMLDAAGGSWVGGPGADRLGGPRCRVGDVRLGRSWECQDETRARTPYSAPIDVWEKVSVAGQRLRVTGSEGPDVIRVNGNRVRLDGLAGDDVLRAPGSAGSWPSAPPAVVRGGAGDDLIRGGYLRDRLLGGPGDDRLYGNRSDDVIRGGRGRDRAIGQGGRDRCSAEVRRSCER